VPASVQDDTEAGDENETAPGTSGTSHFSKDKPISDIFVIETSMECSEKLIGRHGMSQWIMRKEVRFHGILDLFGFQNRTDSVVV
jgi:hypothetical protein